MSEAQDKPINKSASISRLRDQIIEAGEKEEIAAWGRYRSGDHPSGVEAFSNEAGKIASARTALHAAREQVGTLKCSVDGRDCSWRHAPHNGAIEDVIEVLDSILHEMK
jgi:hypothetical protein